MAITIVSTEWEGVVGRNFDAQTLISQARKLQIYKVTVTFGAADDYTGPGGVAVSLLKRGAKSVVMAVCTFSSIGVVAYYDATNNKIVMYETGAAADAVLDELSTADSATNNATFDFLVFAQR